MSLHTDNVIHLIVMHSSLSVEEHFETLVFDGGSLLAAAGGNLGLFLGFSCLSLIFSALYYLSSVIKKVKHLLTKEKQQGIISLKTT